MKYAVRPITVTQALSWVRAVHRRLPQIQGGLFAVAVDYGGVTIGVGIVGNPPAAWVGTARCVISRVAVISDLPAVGRHASPACSMIYGALCRAALALGYDEIWTYTQNDEEGVTLRASNFEFMGFSRGGEISRKNRPRKPVDDPRPKGRWRFKRP